MSSGVSMNLRASSASCVGRKKREEGRRKEEPVAHVTSDSRLAEAVQSGTTVEQQVEAVRKV